MPARWFLKSSVAPAALMAAAGFGLAPAANAQTFNWTGFYLGVDAGAAWGDGKLSSTATCPPDAGGTIGYFCASNIPGSLPNGAAVGAAGSGSGSSTGFTGGVHAGYNLQAGAFVYGIEGDVAAFRLKAAGGASANYPVNPGTGAGVSPADRFTVGVTGEADWLATLRGRVGFATGNLLVYVTGGLAVSDIKVSNNFSDNNVTGGVTGAFGSSSASKLKTGWVLGAGGALALSPNMTVRAEYLYVDLGSVSTSATIRHAGTNPPAAYSNGLTTKADVNASIGRVGVSFKF